MTDWRSARIFLYRGESTGDKRAGRTRAMRRQASVCRGTVLVVALSSAIAPTTCQTTTTTRCLLDRRREKHRVGHTEPERVRASEGRKEHVQRRDSARPEALTLPSVRTSERILYTHRRGRERERERERNERESARSLWFVYLYKV